MKIKKGDTVKIIKGKDVGKQGKILKVIPEDLKVVVEGSNIFKKHVKGDGQDKESAIVDIVKPLPVSNVMLVCQACGKPTRVGFRVSKGKKMRICKKCGKDLDASVVTGSTKKSKSKKVKTKTKKSAKTKVKSKSKKKK
jgi:large subunit ribosomal protein L24